MANILTNIRQRIANRIRPAPPELPVQVCNAVPAGAQSGSQPAMEGRGSEAARENSVVEIETSHSDRKLGGTALIHAAGTHHEEDDIRVHIVDLDAMRADSRTPTTEAVSPATPTCGSLCSSDWPSSLECSTRLDKDDYSPGVAPLRTRVMQRELFRNSPLSPTTPGLGCGSANRKEAFAREEHATSDSESDAASIGADAEPVTFSLREVVANSNLSAFCGKLIELPKRKLALLRTNSAASQTNACIQQGVRCEHGDTCPFACHIDGMSEDFLARRRRKLQQKLGRVTKPGTRAEDQLQVYATKLGESFSDFEVVCDACLQVKHCVEVPNQNKQEKLLICSECMLPLLSGSWYHGMDTSETVDVCSDLIRKASPKVPPRGGSRRGDEEDHQQRTLAELAGPSPGDVVDDEDEFEAACRELEAKRQQAMSERCMARSPSLPISDFADDHPGATSPTGSLTASQADERKDDVPPLDAPFQDRRRPSGATAQLNLPLPGSPSTPTLLSSPAVGESFSEGEFSDNMSMSTFAQSEYSASDLAPGLLPNQIAGQEPVGELEIGLQMGIEANKQRSSFIVDILRGYNFKHWENVGDKPNFEIYIKCYIIFPGRVVKMKTKSVKPSAQPEVLDQLISLMNRKLLQKAERLKVQLWEDHGPLKKKLAVGVATIDLTKLSSSELVMGCYPLYVPARRSPKPSTPTSPSVANVSPGGTPLSLSRSGSGRFGSLRNSFKRREKLRPRSSTGGATAAAAAPSSPLVSEGQLSSSAPTGSPALSSTPSRRLRYGSELGETDL